MPKKAFISGVLGQDGSYLARHLLSKGYTVIGGSRRSSQDDTYRLRALGISEEVEIINFDLTDPFNVFSTISEGLFDEVYNLAAQSFVGASWDLPIQTANVDAMGALYILDAIKRASPNTKFYQASTSEMFGLIQEPIQSEKTPLYPRSPYGVAKQFAHSMTINYRESFGLFACSGILFNHESPLRGKEFVTKKITSQLAEIVAGKRDLLFLGNLDAKRDWGYAEDYVDGMWKMLQSDEPDDYVLATGVTSSVREFCQWAAREAGIHLNWRGSGIDEVGIDAITGNEIIKISERFYRPAEVDLLLGDPTKANTKLNWRSSTSVEKLAQIMMQFDLKQQGLN